MIVLRFAWNALGMKDGVMMSGLKNNAGPTSAAHRR
jgi:hypothetical protein